ncbi:MAG: hypothetical protein R3C19_15085 [Planctomycetaceae bacterium]
MIDDGGMLITNWSYDGHGTPTMRIESDFVNQNDFPQANAALGSSDFFDTIQMDLSGYDYQWDTGVNIPGFIGNTPYSLDRGDIFNVLPGEEPIQADSLEQNDSFAGAYDLGTVAGAGFSVNDLAMNGNLTIETKGDRDYYKFVAGDTGSLDVVVSATDALGDSLQYLIYEIDSLLPTEEVPMVRAADGSPVRTVVPATGTRTLTVDVVAGRTYIIEVLSNEQSNLGIAVEGKPFNYGTVRSYDLTINAPGTPLPPVNGAPANDGGEGAGQTDGGNGGTAQVNIPDQDPFVLDVVDVSPDPRNAAVDTITVMFSEDVTGVDISDFTLTRDGVALNLSGASVVEVTPDVYQVTGLGSLTGLGKADGSATVYELTLTAAGSGIMDVDSALLVGDATESWTLTNQITFTGDSVDADPGNGLFADRNGNASLRAAIMEANASPGLDVLQLAAGTYTLSLAGAFEDAAATGDLDITESIRIVGAGAGSTIIDAAALDRIFHVHPGATLSLENLTIRGGRAADGGGVFVEGRILDSAGAVLTDAGILNLLDVNIVNSEAFNQGGGIYNLGTVNSERSSISFNVAGSRGGGLYNLGIANLRNTTVSTNSAVSRGGGIYTEGTEDEVNTLLTPVIAPARLNSINSTIAANTAGALGGGLYVEEGGMATLGNTIIDINHAGFGRPDLSGRLTSSGNNLIGNLNGTRADSALVASDIAGGVTGGAPVLTAGLIPVTSAGGNGTWHHPFAYGRIDLTGTVSITNATRIVTGSGTQFTTEVLIGSVLTIGDTNFVVESIQSNVQLTVTQAATETISNSAASARARGVDAGNRNLFIPAAGNSLFDEVDQIGNPRLIEGDADAVFAIDIGAVEFLVSDPVASFTATPNPVGQGETVSFDGSASTHTNPGAGSLVLYEWDFDYQNATFTVDATGVTASTSYNTDRDRIVALRVTDNSNKTDIAFVTVIVGVPTRPEIISPFPVTSDSTPTIDWINATGTFSLVINNLSTGQNGVVSQTGLTSNSFTVPASLAPGQYEVIVTATNADGSTSSLPYEFEIVQIQLQNPANGQSGFDTSPNFVWNAVPNTERYVLWVNQRTPVATPRIVFEEFIDGTTSVSLDGLTASFEVINSLPVGTYTAWVQAIDDNGNAGDWSPATQFEISRIMVTGPAPATHSILDRTPTITWTGLGANQYELWVTQLSGETKDTSGNTVPLTSPKRVIYLPALQLQPGAPREYTPTTPLNNGQYRIWVRPLADDGEPGLWSPAYDLQVDFRVGPTAISPTGTVTDRTPEFVWTAIDGADHYELWVNRAGSNPATRVIYNNDIPHVNGATTIKYTDPAVKLINPGHRWWVRAFTADGTPGAWSAVQTFFIPAPAMTGPSGAITNTGRPTFTWTGVPEYVRYELWVNNTTTGVSRAVYETQLTGTSFTPDLPLQNGTFRAWVRGFDAQGNDSQWSNPIVFSINTAPTNAPTLLSPSGVTTDNTPTFTWNAGGPAVAYELILKQITNLGQQEVAHPTGITGTSYQQTTLLSPGTYRWWVRGLNVDGNPSTAWSQPRDFRVVSAEVPAIDGFASPLIPGESAAEAIVTSLDVTDWKDNLHSITVHPAAVVATYHSNAVEAQTAVLEEVPASAEDENYRQLDAVLEAFAVDGFWSELPGVELQFDDADSDNLPGVPAAVIDEAVVQPAEQQERSYSAAAVAIGIAASTRRRRVRNEEE